MRRSTLRNLVLVGSTAGFVGCGDDDDNGGTTSPDTAAETGATATGDGTDQTGTTAATEATETGAETSTTGTPGETDETGVDTGTTGTDTGTTAGTGTTADAGATTGAALCDENVMTIADPSFEDGTPNPFWEEFTSNPNYTTPLCDPQTCEQEFADEGQWWAWFGGTFMEDEWRLSQSIVVPQGADDLLFSFAILATGGLGTDSFTMTVDGEVVFMATEAEIDAYPLWTTVAVDISDFADGGQHELVLFAETAAPVGESTTSFFVDFLRITCQ